MLSLSMALVVVLFFVFVFLDLISLLPRLAGSIVKYNGLGFSFQIIVNTSKRVFLVLLPPALGMVVLLGSEKDVFLSILAAHFVSIASFFLALLLRRALLEYFCRLIILYANNGKLFRSSYLAITYVPSIDFDCNFELSISALRFEFLPAAIWIFFFYTSSGFLVNILALWITDFTVVILQLTGVFNALGTMALAFFLDPRITRVYEASDNPESVYVTMFVAQFINIVIISPSVYLIIAVSFFQFSIV